MRFLLGFLGVVAALIFIGASAMMNWSFMTTLGRSSGEGHVFGLIAIACDIMKALLPFFIVWAWAARRFAFVGIGSALFCVFLAASFAAALGFSSLNRGAVVGSKDAQASRLAVVAADYTRELARLNALTERRPVRVIEAELDGLRQDRRWSTSKECSEATAQTSREFCQQVAAVKGALAAAVEADRVRGRVGQLAKEKGDLEAAGAAIDSDPQASLFARLSGVDIKHVQLGWVVFMAVLVELGAAFGLWLAVGHGFGRVPGERPEPPNRRDVIDVTPEIMSAPRRVVVNGTGLLAVRGSARG